MFGQFVRNNRNEDDIVNPQNDFKKAQSEQCKPSIGF
jgi:hypothetical protein